MVPQQERRGETARNNEAKHVCRQSGVGNELAANTRRCAARSSTCQLSFFLGEVQCCNMEVMEVFCEV
jgi:hypothetical protein